MQNSIYYAIIIKKKSGVIKLLKKIDWQLSDNNAVLIDLKDVYCRYEGNKFLEFAEKETKNYIDLVNKVYKRNTKDYTMEIDFINNICTFLLDNNERLSFECTNSIKVDKNMIIINYKIADDAKTIKIKMKEE